MGGVVDAAVIVALIALAGSAFATAVSAWSKNQTTEMKAELNKQHKAMGRLQDAVGPLRLELFLSTRSVIRRLTTFSKHPHAVETYQRPGNDEAYHDGGLLIYRLLRPLAVSSLIEPTLYFADLSLDKATVDLLDFSHAAFEMLTGEQIGYGSETNRGTTKPFQHPTFDPRRCRGLSPPVAAAESGTPIQRMRASYLRTAADALLWTNGPESGHRKRCMGHPEFLERWENPDVEEYKKWHERLAPAKQILDRFEPKKNPVLWLRLVGYAYTCKWFFDEQRDRAALEGIDHFNVDLPTEKMLRSSGDEHLAEYAVRYEPRFAQIILDAL